MSQSGLGFYIYLNIVIKKIDENLTDDQFEFRRNIETLEAILCFILIIEKFSK